MACAEDETSGVETTITITRGDSSDLLVTVQDDEDPPNLIDLSKSVSGTADRPAIIRFAVKDDPDEDSNEDALIFKHSAYEDQIEVLAQTGSNVGKLRVLIDKPETEEADLDADYRWDIEVTRQDTLRTGAQAGTVTFAAGSKTVVGVGTAFTSAKKGDVLQPTSGTNSKPAIITQIDSATSMEVDHSNWSSDTLVTFEIRRGKSKTAAKGPFVIESGVVAE